MIYLLAWLLNPWEFAVALAMVLADRLGLGLQWCES